MKPVELVRQAIEDASSEGQVVADLFGGSGTTLVACDEANRHSRLMELDPKFCAVILDRAERMGCQIVKETQS